MISEGLISIIKKVGKTLNKVDKPKLDVKPPKPMKKFKSNIKSRWF